MLIGFTFKTLSVKVPAALAARVEGYTLANGDTVSGFIKSAILVALGSYQCDTPIPMEVSKSEADAVLSKVGKVLAATSAMPPAKRAATMATLMTVVSNAKPHFDMVAATDAKYAGAYKSLMMQVRNAHRAAETRALTAPVMPDTPHAVRKLKDIPPPNVRELTPKTFYDVTEGELIALGYPPELREHNQHLDLPDMWDIWSQVGWLRGECTNLSGVSPNWLPRVRSPEAEAELALHIERNQARIAEGNAKASPKTLEYFQKRAAHLATLP